MSSRKSISTILLVVGAILIITSLGLFMSRYVGRFVLDLARNSIQYVTRLFGDKNKNLNQSPTPQATSSPNENTLPENIVVELPVSTTTPVLLSTDNWQTYRHNSSNFSIKYPLDWVREELNLSPRPSTKGDFTEQGLVELRSYLPNDDLSKGYGRVRVSLRNYASSTDPNYYETLKSNYRNLVYQHEFREVQISGRDGFEVITKDSADKNSFVQDVFFMGEKSRQVVHLEGTIFNPSSIDDSFKKEAGTSLYSFNFTAPEESDNISGVSTVGWKIYQAERYLCQLSYPPNWTVAVLKDIPSVASTSQSELSVVFAAPNASSKVSLDFVASGSGSNQTIFDDAVKIFEKKSNQKGQAVSIGAASGLSWQDSKNNPTGYPNQGWLERIYGNSKGVWTISAFWPQSDITAQQRVSAIIQTFKITE